MSNISVNPSAAAAVFARRAAPVVDRSDAPGSGGPFLLLSGYEGANDSPGRGYLYWRSTDTRRALTDFSDEEIRRRVQWLCANSGIARRLYRAPAKLLGIKTPMPVTSKKDWNKRAFENFKFYAGNKDLFDKKGRYNFKTVQPAMNRARFKDGRILSVLTKNAIGGAAVMLYEAHQIRNGESTSDRFEQGVRLDRFDRHEAYAVQDGKDPDKESVIDSRDAMYYANWESPGPIHGLSILAHAVVNLIDVVELRGMRKHAAKNHASMGMAVETAPTAKIISGGAAGVTGPMIQQEVVLTNGDVQKVNWEIMTTQGHIPTLAPGQSIKVIADDRPTTNNLEFEKILIEDCVLGEDLPAAAIYSAAGFTGPAMRFSMEEVKRWIQIEEQQQEEWCRRYWAYHIACEIDRGRLDDPDEPYWRLVTWLSQPDMTIDRGRDGSLAVNKLERGLTTWGREYAKDGEHGDTVIEERIEEVARAKAAILAAQEKYEVDLTWSEVFPAWKDSGLDSASDGKGDPPASSSS
jgi:capsid protein